VGVDAAETVAATVSTGEEAETSATVVVVVDDDDDGNGGAGLPTSGFTASLRGLTAGAGLPPDDVTTPADDVIVGCSPVNK